MPRQYPEEFKKQVVSFYAAGNPLSAVSEKYQLAQSTIYRWCREYDHTGDPSTVKDCAALRRQCERLERILQIIRLSNIIEGVPRRKRLEILAKLHEQIEQYSVHELCEALDISRGTFYNHIFRRADRTEYSLKQQELMKQVQQIFNDSKQRFGAEKIRITLRECGIHIGKRRIREIMKELGLVSVRENAKRNYRNRQKYLKRDLLNQEFKTTRLWVSDITYFKIKGVCGISLCHYRHFLTYGGRISSFSKMQYSSGNIYI